MQNVQSNHKVVINDKSSVNINCVEGVSAFDEDSVTVDIKDGKIIVEGASLRIEDLQKNSGEITIVGNIKSVQYLEKSIKKKGRSIF